MERTRLRELTHYASPKRGLYSNCRNGAYPIKGIDTLMLQARATSRVGVEMERTRLRELTHRYYIICHKNPSFVEMERTRLRELTHI